VKVLLILWMLVAQAAPSNAVDATRVLVSAPRIVVDLDAGKLKGEPWRLSWSPDGTQLYVQTVQRDKVGNPTSSRHFLVAIESGKVSNTDGEPAWAADYWRWKSAQAPPGAPSQRIDVEHRNETVRATAAPMGGDLARGALSGGPTTGTSVADAANAALQSQTVSIYTLRWHGELLGEWTNTPVIPGLTFG
jgi:hypothetical protein